MDSVKGVLVRDDILDAKSDIKFGIYRGPASFNPFQQSADTASSSNLTFTYNVPSQDLFVSKAVRLAHTLPIVITSRAVTAADIGKPLFQYGLDSSVCPWGIFGAVSTATLKLNNVSVATDVQNTLQVLNKMYDYRQLAAYNNIAPMMPDTLFFNYADAVGSNYNPNGGINNCTDPDLMPRGAFPISSVSFTSAGGTNRAGQGIPIVQAGDIVAGVGAVFTVSLTVECVVPVPCSPLIWDGELSVSKGGMYGLNVFNLQLQLNSGAKLFRTASDMVASCALGAIQRTQCFLHFDVVSPHADMAFSSVNIHPYMNVDVKIDPVGSAVPAATTNPDGTIKPADASISTSSSITLNNLFDKVAFFVRPTYGNQTCKSADNSLVIDNFSLSLGNYSGLLSQAKRSQLYTYARKAGLNQVWADWQGSNNRWNSSTNTISPVASNGNIVVLDLGSVIALQDPSLAPGCVLNTSFQLFNVQVKNYSADAFATGQLELVMLFFSSGAIRIDRGVASSYLGLITREMVLDVVEEANKSGQYYYGADVKRMIGGGLLNMLKTVASNFALPLIEKHVLPALIDVAKKKLGSGMSAGGTSAGARKKLADHYAQ
jgi:hypothetical protein